MRHRKRIRISSYEAETRDPSSEERMTLFEDDSIPQDRETSPRRKRVRSLSPPKFIEKSSSHDVFQSSGAIVGALVTENQELKAKVTRLERVIAGLECALAQVVKK
jgi:hypothetical protein